MLKTALYGSAPRKLSGSVLFAAIYTRVKSRLKNVRRVIIPISTIWLLTLNKSNLVYIISGKTGNILGLAAD